MAPLEMKRGKGDDYGQQLVESREERQAEGDAASRPVFAPKSFSPILNVRNTVPRENTMMRIVPERMVSSPAFQKAPRSSGRAGGRDGSENPDCPADQ